MQKRIAISLGDYNGVGPEVVIKTLAESDLTGDFAILLLGHTTVVDYYCDNLGVKLDYKEIKEAAEATAPGVYVINVHDMDDSRIRPGYISADAGTFSMKAVGEGVDICTANEALAIVTAPINKEAIHLAGFEIPGHTEFLSHRTRSRKQLMLMASKTLRVGLVTGHIPLSEVARSVTFDKIYERLKTLHTGLVNDFGIANPHIAVLGLNPHAGDGGVIGNEELQYFHQVLDEARQNGIHAVGPFSADAFFGSGNYKNYDAVLAMYHDQGLIPFKTLSFHEGVNVTLGLPLVRTSPDHGTAYDIAGKNKAHPGSFTQALELAVVLGNNRRSSRSKKSLNLKNDG